MTSRCGKLLEVCCQHPNQILPKCTRNTDETNEGENDDAEPLDVLEARSVDEQVKHDSITIVHAVGVFRNSPNEALGQDDLDSLKKYILSEDHLHRNIASIEFLQTSKL